jgi:hypothetical protein
MIAVIRKNMIKGLIEGSHDSDLADLLSQARVGRSGNQPVLEKLENERFCRADKVCQAIENPWIRCHLWATERGQIRGTGRRSM